MIRRRFAIFAVLCCAAPLLAAPAENLSKQLGDLNNPDPVVRDQARQDLMSLKRPQLDELRQAVVAAGTVTPEQTAELHEIVMQVFLADSEQQNDAVARGFLGASPLPCQVQDASGKTCSGILIAQRIPGFDAYRMLRTGDIILAINGDSGATRDIQAFMTTIQNHAPGQQLKLQIRRGNRTLDVLVQLSARPISADNLQAPDLFQTQRDRIEQYWRTNFAPIIKQSK